MTGLPSLVKYAQAQLPDCNSHLESCTTDRLKRGIAGLAKCLLSKSSQREKILRHYLDMCVPNGKKQFRLPADNLLKLPTAISMQRDVKVHKGHRHALHRLHNGSRPRIDANQFISQVGLAPFRAGCGLCKQIQSRPLTVFSQQSTCPCSEMAAEVHVTKEESVARRRRGRVQCGELMQRGGGRSGGLSTSTSILRLRGQQTSLACTSCAALDARRFVGRSFLNELAAEGMARERRYDGVSIINNNNGRGDALPCSQERVQLPMS